MASPLRLTIRVTPPGPRAISLLATQHVRQALRRLPPRPRLLLLLLRLRLPLRHQSVEHRGSSFTCRLKELATAPANPILAATGRRKQSTRTTTSMDR